VLPALKRPNLSSTWAVQKSWFAVIFLAFSVDRWRFCKLPILSLPWNTTSHMLDLDPRSWHNDHGNSDPQLHMTAHKQVSKMSGTLCPSLSYIPLQQGTCTSKRSTCHPLRTDCVCKRNHGHVCTYSSSISCCWRVAACSQIKQRR
jgi:hypothetical protein